MPTEIFLPLPLMLQQDLLMQSVEILGSWCMFWSQEMSLKFKNERMSTTMRFLVGMCSACYCREFGACHYGQYGKLLADALGYYHFDNDSLVEEACGGESAAKSLKEQDEEEFRDSQTEVLKQLSSMGQLVVCAGNGSVHSSINLALLGHGISIWIDLPIEMVAKNVIEEGFKFL
ncbi:hypothetical protein AAG906_021560 [Vitis piasezkii]